MNEVRIGTRASALALAQAGSIKKMLEKKHPSTRFSLVKIQTLGDEFQSVEVFRKSGVGIFTKAIEKLHQYEYHQSGLSVAPIVAAMENCLHYIASCPQNGHSMAASYTTPAIIIESRQ